MPKKRGHVKTFKPCPPVSSLSPPSSSRLAEKSSKSVNELLATLRHSATGSQSSPQSLPTTSPSLPPAIREILQIPESPSPTPRRPGRRRLDDNGRRLPAGPAPPRSWLLRQPAALDDVGNTRARSLRISYSSLGDTVLPGAQLPHTRSLIGITLRRLAIDWHVHRVYNQYHLYFIPNHLKPALIRYVGLASEAGISLTDLKTILLPPECAHRDDQLDNQASANSEISCLDLTASIGRSLSLKDILNLLFTHVEPGPVAEELQDSWEAADGSPSPSRLLLPNLTHLSLALDPQRKRDVSWKQLLALSSKLPTVTHLSLAYWPEPCLTSSRTKSATISSPHGHKIPYGGTTIYSHCLDHDWSETLLVLRMLSNNFYKLEFLDLTGCAPWFEALQRRDGHDFIDWSSSWGKVTELRLSTGWKLGAEAMPSDREAYARAVDTAKGVEKHIRNMRAGKGRFITVQRDEQDT